MRSNFQRRFVQQSCHRVDLPRWKFILRFFHSIIFVLLFLTLYLPLPIRAIWHVVKRKRKINFEISRKSKDRSCNTYRLDNREAASKDLIVSCRNYTKRGAIYSRQTCRFSSSLQYCEQIFVYEYTQFLYFSQAST